MGNIIYIHTNTITKKSYIGRTLQTIESRFKQHLNLAKRNKGFKFHRALRKYGENAFESQILEENLSEEQAQIRETYWINYYDSYENGYNMTLGGSCGLISDESKEKYTKTVTTLDENRSSIAKRRYIKRNKTLFKKDKNFLKSIGMKSSKTQKKNKFWKKYIKKTKILLFDNNGNLVDSFLYRDRNKNKFGCPSRMIEYSLRKNKPMYTQNPPRDESKRKYICWFACYENEAWCDINTKFKDVSIKEKYKTYFKIFNNENKEIDEINYKGLRKYCIDNNIKYNQMQYSYRNGGKKIKNGKHSGWYCIIEKVKL